MRPVALALLFLSVLTAAEQKGKVQFGGLPVPGATVTAAQGDRSVVAITDPDGTYSFTDLPDGTWNFQIEMLGFATLKQDVTVAAGPEIPAFELKLRSFEELKAMAGPQQAPEPPRISISQSAAPAPAATGKGKKASAPANANQNSFQRTAVNANPNAGAAPPASTSAAAEAIPPDANQKAADGLLINGTVNNGASSPFAQANAFGNNRRGPGSLYNGSVGLILDNSALDARTFSYTGQDTPKPAYDHLQAVATFGGPIRIPHVVRNGPIFFIAYQLMRNHTATTNSYLMPTEAQRTELPASLISPQALALLKFYPLPNFTGSSLYNFQIPIVGETHQDSMQTRLNKNIGNRNTLYGQFAFQRTAIDTPNQFGFLDKTSSLGTNSQANWTHRFGSRMFAHFQVSFSRFSSTASPFFANRENVSGEAGIAGNNQDPLNYGPPTLNFSSGISALTDGVASAIHNQTTAYTFDDTWNRGRHNITFGGDFKRVEFNSIGQQNPRGTFTFTGAATGNDFTDFLEGIPDTSQIAYGNADKYFRESQYDAFINDDWRIGPSLTVLAGVRWEYNAPITELYGRLVNLAIGPDFSSATPVVAAANPVGLPTSLLRPDKHAFQPRVGLAWRPIPASSLVVRAGYGVYYNTSVYQQIATQMAQQSPLSRSLSIQNTAASLLTLSNGFNAPPGALSNTFAVDPNFRIGYAQNFQLSVQRDLPGSLVATATYLGIKGTRGPQEFLPNTYPAGAVNPCPTCPSGFIYMTSNGDSTRQSGQLQLRRRLRNGFTWSANYTFSKSIDDSALGGRGQASNVIAQNWLDLAAERGLSNFDQRHLLNFTTQYTTGQGIGGGTLLNGWRGTLFKEWTVTSTINAGSGLPLTPTVIAAVLGTGVTGPIRPEYTGAPLYSAPSGLFLNPAAYTLAPSGQWGNAGRDSITGPEQFTLASSLGRTFRLRDRYSLDVRVDATNAINHVTFASWNTIVNSGQFGLPTPPANPMRSLQTTLRVRF